MPKSNSELAQSLRKLLDRHGHSFQFTVAGLIKQLHSSGWTRFHVEATEFPVSLQGRDTRIDLLLWQAQTANMLICECKRVNPARAAWCFLKAPDVQRRPIVDAALDVVSTAPGGDHVRVSGACVPAPFDSYHLAMELKTGAQGDESGENHGAIEDAATQVCRGCNGYIMHLTETVQRLGTLPRIVLMPVIFTTAKLFVSDVNLSKADLESGEFAHELSDLRSVPSVYLQFPLSRGIKHTRPLLGASPEPAKELAHEFVRTIAVVTADGIEKFLYDFRMPSIPGGSTLSGL